jgi:hypothetical protein
MEKFKESPDKYSISYADPGSVLYLVSFPDFGDSLEVLGEPGTTLAEADLFARGRFGGERIAVSVLRAGVNSAKREPKREIAGSATGLYLADINPTKTKRSALGLKREGKTTAKGAELTWSIKPGDLYSDIRSPGVMLAGPARTTKTTWRATRSTTPAERLAGQRNNPEVIIHRNTAKGHRPNGQPAPPRSIDLWVENRHGPGMRLRVQEWKGTAAQLLKHYDRIWAKELGIPEPGLKKATKKATKKAATKAATKKAPATKKAATKRARPKGDDEIRLLKRSGKLIATFGVSYKLTQAMEEIRDCARRSKPCKLKTVIRAYDQLRNAAKAAGKTPRQGLAYYVAAEIAKDLKRSDELKATTNGDLPRIKEA